MTLPLEFGVPGLDKLIDPRDEQKSANANNVRWTAAIVGPDGCGKSILSLHLASTYWDINCNPEKIAEGTPEDPQTAPKVIYVSTDLSYGQAEAQWKNFGLGYPRERKEAIRAAYSLSKLPKQDWKKLTLSVLKPVVSGQDGNLLAFFQKEEPAVYFFDLQSETAGDDWGFVNHLLGLLEPQRLRKDGQIRRHLLIIDAVEGLETFVGQQDAYGLDRDRRSRVAQLVRNAGRIGAHVVFVVEEPKSDTRLPEQFVTDLVIRLRQEMDGNYSQRTVEIEKCRAVAHARGQHEIAIRNGSGSYTGKAVHLDDPSIPWAIPATDPLKTSQPNDGDKSDDQTEGNYLAHLHVTRSLHRWNREVREEKATIPELQHPPLFGLPVIDNLLVSTDTFASSKNANHCQGSMTLLVGDAATQKGPLGRAFLAQAFWRDGAIDYQNGAAVLITTRFMDGGILRDRLAQHLTSNDHLGIAEKLEDRVFCQRLSVRHVSSGAFLEMLTLYVRAAQKLVLAKDSIDELVSMPIEVRRRESYRIRFVLEDWSALLNMYPSLRNDPLLLESILLLFKREGITSLIISTQPGPPGLNAPVHPHDVTNLDEMQVRTWIVPFYEDRRVAVTVNATHSYSRPPIICELQTMEGGERLKVDRHFDQYADVDLGKPHRVPLLVRLYLGSHSPDSDDIKSVQFLHFVRDVFLQHFAGPGGQEVVKIEPSLEYDSLFTYSDVLDDSHLDHTLVFQVDEFWVPSHAALLNLTDYWNAEVAKTQHELINQEFAKDIKVYEPHPDDQPGIFRPHATWHVKPESDDPVPRISSRDEVFSPKDGGASWQRWSFFVDPEHGGQPRKTPEETPAVHRIPYLWDFGILLANRDVWNRHKDVQLEGLGGSTVASLWNKLCPSQPFSLGLDREKTADPATLSAESRPGGTSELDRKTKADLVTWQQFLSTCRKIAELEQIPAFDVDLCTVETLSCWVLELWLSFQSEFLKHRPSPHLTSLTTRSTKPTVSLLRLLELYPCSLLKALVHVVLTCPQLRSKNRVVYREHASTRSVASREWFHTASALMRRNPSEHFVPLGLPGCYSVRGDWSLVAAAGSRSEVLAHRALDLLSSRRHNLLRMQDGIGLPVRDILPDANIGDLPTALTCYDESGERTVPLSYREVCRLGPHKEKVGFSWLWRSQIDHYSRDSFYWRRWLSRMLEEQHEWFPPKCRFQGASEILESLQLPGWWEEFSADPQLATGPKSVFPSVAEVFANFEKRLGIIKSALRT